MIGSLTSFYQNGTLRDTRLNRRDSETILSLVFGRPPVNRSMRLAMKAMKGCVDSAVPDAKISDMEISFAPELEAKLRRVASETGRGAEQVVQELVETYMEHDQWFRQEVQVGLAQLDRGESIDHDEVVARIERMFHS
jgi:predicted transcriptional regulator